LLGRFHEDSRSLATQRRYKLAHRIEQTNLHEPINPEYTECSNLVVTLLVSVAFVHYYSTAIQAAHRTEPTNLHESINPEYTECSNLEVTLLVSVALAHYYSTAIQAGTSH
jgi:hypothetical protein